MRSKLVFSYLTLGLLLIVSGCEKTYQLTDVEGTLTINGQPGKQMMVQFQPDSTVEGVDGPHSTAITDDNGHFVLTCDNNKKGAVIGPHRITVSDMNEERPAQGQERKSPPRIDPKYQSASTTPLKMEVMAEKKVYDIDIK